MRQNSTIPGGRYLTADGWVDANGKPVAPPEGMEDVTHPAQRVTSSTSSVEESVVESVEVDLEPTGEVVPVGETEEESTSEEDDSTEEAEEEDGEEVEEEDDTEETEESESASSESTTTTKPRKRRRKKK